MAFLLNTCPTAGQLLILLTCCLDQQPIPPPIINSGVYQNINISVLADISCAWNTIKIVCNLQQFTLLKKLLAQLTIHMLCSSKAHNIHLCYHSLYNILLLYQYTYFPVWNLLTWSFDTYSLILKSSILLIDWLTDWTNGNAGGAACFMVVLNGDIPFVAAGQLPQVASRHCSAPEASHKPQQVSVEVSGRWGWAE